MASFFRPDYSAGTGTRLTGFSRYTELLGRDYKLFFSVNLLTFLGFLPFLTGIIYSILTSSILILIPSCIIGGAIAGPCYSCLCDTIFRSLRDAPGKCLDNYKRAWRQNWRQSVLPGIIFCLLLGFYAFMIMLFWWSTVSPGLGTIAIYVFGLVIFTMFFSIFWPQVALFEQTNVQSFKNCILFMIRFFWRTLGCSILVLLYWGIMILFLPWSMFLMPFLGFWFIMFSADFLLYDTINEAFGIEDQIAQAFPEQTPYYESDEEWVKRKQEEKKR